MLLAIDTSTAQVGIALYDGHQVLGESLWTGAQHHTVQLAPAVAELLKRTGAVMSEVLALGVAIGPGSFTSLRVGLAFVKGLALARKLPVVGVPSLDVLAAAQPATKHRLAAVLQAGRGRVAVGWYKHLKEGWKPEGIARVMTIETLADKIDKPTLVAGELSAEERQRLARKKVNVILAAPSLCVRRPAVLAEVAWRLWQSGEISNTASLAPIYLHLDNPIQA